MGPGAGVGPARRPGRPGVSYSHPGFVEGSGCVWAGLFVGVIEVGFEATARARLHGLKCYAGGSVWERVAPEADKLR